MARAVLRRSGRRSIGTGHVTPTEDFVTVGPNHVLSGLLMRRVEDPQAGPTLEMDLRDEVNNPHGSLHGGLMGVLIECGASGAALRAVGSANIVASDMSIRFLTAVKVGPARVITTILRRGRRAVIVQADVIDVGADRKLVATATISYALLDGG